MSRNDEVALEHIEYKSDEFDYLFLGIGIKVRFGLLDYNERLRVLKDDQKQ